LTALAIVTLPLTPVSTAVQESPTSLSARELFLETGAVLRFLATVTSDWGCHHTRRARTRVAFHRTCVAPTIQLFAAGDSARPRFGVSTPSRLQGLATTVAHARRTDRHARWARTGVAQLWARMRAAAVPLTRLAAGVRKPMWTCFRFEHLGAETHVLREGRDTMVAATRALPLEIMAHDVAAVRPPNPLVHTVQVKGGRTLVARPDWRVAGDLVETNHALVDAFPELVCHALRNGGQSVVGDALLASGHSPATTCGTRAFTTDFLLSISSFV